MQYTDAPSQLFWRVERPQLLFSDANSSVPLGLVNGVCADGITCLETPGKTWTLVRPTRAGNV